MVLIVDHIIHLMNIRAANDLIVFSDTLSKQIPYSRAAVAFNVFQRDAFSFEILRLCAMWDLSKADDLEAKISLPTVVQLVDDPLIIQALAEETRAAHLIGGLPRNYTKSSDTEEEAVFANAMRESQEAFARDQASMIARSLRSAIAWVKLYERGRRVEAIRNYRDKHIAHALTRTWLEVKKAKAGDTVDAMKNGDARWLFRRTVAIANNLYLTINGRSFSWGDSIRIAERNAREFWHSCRFQLPPDRRTKAGDDPQARGT